ncbi:hypothetical protein [Mycoplasma sp. ATU-Cv-508]|uniref:hypothetical protein n=1 Tax=Mycoplasma sp. ATU-Cv-508 TaxID=2048001 RepID=UPI000FDF0F76
MNKHPLISALIKTITDYPEQIRIGYPDGADPRILKAVQKLAELSNVKTVVISPEMINTYPRQKIIDLLTELRGQKNDSETIARWASDPTTSRCV